MVSTWARMVRVGHIQANEAMINAMIWGLSNLVITDAITTSTAKAGIESATSARVRMIESTMPPK